MRVHTCATSAFCIVLNAWLRGRKQQANVQPKFLAFALSDQPLERNSSAHRIANNIKAAPQPRVAPQRSEQCAGELRECGARRAGSDELLRGCSEICTHCGWRLWNLL
jgi:hypothetical protein